MEFSQTLLAERAKPAGFRLGNHLVDPDTRRIVCGSRSRRLSPKATRILSILAAADGKVVSRDDLLDQTWPDVTVGEEVLTQAIAELRRALDDSARSPRFIETVHKTGYRLIAPVRPCGGARTEPCPMDRDLLRSDDLRDLDFEAYALHLQACVAFDRGGARNINEAAAMFSEVIRVDPSFAPAYAGLARSLAFIDMYYGPPGDHIVRALEACDTGLRVDQWSHEVLAAQGTVFSAAGKAEQAFVSFRAAMRRQPHCAATHYLLGRALFAEGEFAMAAAMQEQAARLNPEDFHSLLLAAKARRRTGDERNARANLIRANQRIDQHLLAYPDDFRALCDKACCLIELGEKDTALNLMEPLFTHNDPMSYYLVCFLARADEIPLALRILDETVEAGWSHGPVLRHDPDIDPLRREMQFRRIEQRVEMR